VQESNCKIAIRGRGSVKEGRSRKDTKPDPSDNEDLHVLVTGDTDQDVDRVRRGRRFLGRGRGRRVGEQGR
jgi:hypothetical protein